MSGNRFNSNTLCSSVIAIVGTSFFLRSLRSLPMTAFCLPFFDDNFLFSFLRRFTSSSNVSFLLF